MKKELVFFLFLVLGVFVISSSLINAATINVVSCSQADVQAAINMAQDGDTVRVPAGECIWDSTVTIPDTKGVKIVGAGVNHTKITGTANPKFRINIASASSTFTRISNITFHEADYQAVSVHQTIPFGAESIGRYRIDNCHFINHKGILLYGNAYGVIDNCFFYRDGTAFYAYMIFVSGTTGGSDWMGSHSWTESPKFGSQYFHYFENNTLEFTEWATTRNWADGHSGAKSVFRYNTLTNAGIPIGGHDACTSYRRGYMAYESYNNDVRAEAHVWSFTAARGGTGVIYNNTFRAKSLQSQSFLWFNSPVYRYVSPNCGAPWNNMCNNIMTKFCIKAGNLCDTDDDCTLILGDVCVLMDGHEDDTGYPCRDQFGTAPNGTGMKTHPIVSWNNLYCIDSEDPLNCNPTKNTPLRWNSAHDDVVKYERNVIDYNSLTGIGSCNDGIDHDGDGFIDMNDPICAEFWDPVNNKLAGYTPLVYPHPLRLEDNGEIIPDPIPPTSDIVTVQDMLGAYQQYKRNEVSLIYFLDKLRRWIVFW